MAGGNERDDVFAAAKLYHWTIASKEGKNGYRKMTCACGKHISWLHKTPSNPHYYRERIKFMRRTCPGPEGKHDNQ